MTWETTEPLELEGIPGRVDVGELGPAGPSPYVGFWNVFAAGLRANDG